jgi:hypothetical protein
MDYLRLTSYILDPVKSCTPPARAGRLRDKKFSKYVYSWANYRAYLYIVPFLSCLNYNCSFREKGIYQNHKLSQTRMHLYGLLRFVCKPWGLFLYKKDNKCTVFPRRASFEYSRIYFQRTLHNLWIVYNRTAIPRNNHTDTGRSNRGKNKESLQKVKQKELKVK